MRISVIATAFPSIALVFGALMIVAGNIGGWLLVFLGGGAQAMYLLTK